ncbi:MAG: hypothetical protein ACPG6B_08175 [Oceanihabitans sp.]
MKSIKNIFIYYKALFWWSFTINLIVLLISKSILLTVVTKLFITLLFGLLLNDFSVRRKIGFYKMVGVSNLKLLSILFIIDCLVSFLFILLIKGFA